jgi:hypothetical protein
VDCETLGARLLRRLRPVQTTSPMTLFAGSSVLRASNEPARGRETLGRIPDEERHAPMPTPMRNLSSLPSRRGTRACFCVLICLSWLTSCTGRQLPPASTVSSGALIGADLAGATATVARKQRWNCQRIQQAIKNLIAAMQEAKARAEKHEEQAAPTLLQMLARMSGPPGAGNPALGEFQKARRDADQLNDLLRVMGCATHPIGVAPPRFSKR